MPQSVGGLYLQVKLQTDAVEADIRRLGKMYEQAFNGKNGVVASSGAAAGKNTSSVIVAGTKAQAKAEADYQKLLKQQEAILARVNAEQAASNKATMAAAIKAAQFRAQTNNASMAELQKQIQATGRAADAQVREARRGATAAISESNRVLAQVSRASAAQEAAAKRTADAQVRASKRAADAAVRDAKKAGSVSKALGAGSQELFVGLGAARSGNVFYGLAAGVRYAKNLTSALDGASVATKALTIGSAAAVLSVAAIGAAVGTVAVKLGMFGVEQAANFQMLRIQLEGLLGSAARADAEFKFLIDLGKTSIVPTQSLIAADRQMLAFGVTADATRQSLVKFMSDFGTATGAGEQQVYYLSLALGQVAAIGKANSVDMRQLANAGINTMQVYEIIGKSIGKTAQEVAAGVSDGIITADRLYAALAVYGKEFAVTAEKARNSTQGLLSNIKDLVVSNMGIAFEQVNEQVAGMLKQLMEIVSAIDFGYLAESIGNVIGYFGQVLGNFGTDSETLVVLMAVTLPNAINETGYYAARTVGLIKTLIDSVRLLFDSVFAIFASVEVAFSALMIPVSALAMVLGADDTWDLGAVIATFQEFQVMASDAIAQVARDVDALNAAWEIDPMKTLSYVMVDRTSSGGYSGIPYTKDGALNKMPLKPPASIKPDPLPTGSGKSGKAGLTPEQQAALDSAKAWVEKYKKVLGDASSARDKFRELTRQPFGTPSEIQKGFGSGSVDTIISSYDSLRAAIADFYKPLTDAALVGKKAAAQGKADRKAAFDQLKSQASQLIALANDSSRIRDVKDASGWDRTLPNLDDWYSKESDRIKTELSNLDQWRSERETAINAMYDGLLNSANKSLDAATAKYEEANGKLSDLISERDSFLKSLTDSMRSFVNDLTLVETELQKYTRLDNAGSFMVETTKSTASFKDGLQSRLDALKSWTANIRKLMASGLDSSLIQQFVSAGVSGSADVVSQLAAGDSATITAVNDIQAQLAAETASFSSAASAQWFDAGVAQAEAYVVPLRSAMAAAQAEVARLEAERVSALNILKASYDEQKALAEQNLKDLEAKYEKQKTVLNEQIASNDAAAQAVAANIQATFAALSSTTLASGIAVVQGLIDGIQDKAKELELINAAKRLARLIKSTLNDGLGVSSPSKVTTYIGSQVGAGLVVGMDGSIGAVVAASNRLASSSVPSTPALQSVTQPSMPRLSGGSTSISGLAGGVDGSAPQFDVRVFLGDRELTDMVRTEINGWDSQQASYVSTGRRV